MQYTIAMFIIVNAVAVLMALHMKKKLVTPVNSIAKAAEEYIKERKDGNNPKGTFKSLEISTGDEIENSALTMADMEQDIADYEKTLRAYRRRRSVSARSLPSPPEFRLICCLTSRGEGRNPV